MEGDVGTGKKLDLVKAPEVPALALSGVVPMNMGGMAAVDATITLTFNRPVVAGTGMISIANKTAGTSQAIDVADGSQVLFSGSTMIIDPVGDFPLASLMEITFGAGAVKDSDGIGFAGVASGVVDFTTVPDSKTASVISAGAPHWGGQNVGSAVAITYAFMTDGTDQGNAATVTGVDGFVYRISNSSFAPMSQEATAAAASIMAALKQYANITISPLVLTGGNSWHDAAIRLGTNDQMNVGYEYGSPPRGNGRGGAVFITNNAISLLNSAFDRPVAGNLNYVMLLRGILRALGLKAPDNATTGAGIAEGPYLPDDLDNSAYSVMAQPGGAAVVTGLWPATPSIFDVSALQYLYGANMGAAPSNDVYKLDTRYLETIWDPNGVNTLDGGGNTDSMVLDLREGQFSRVGGYTVRALALGTKMQGAMGGAGNDTIHANALGDTINGGAGMDTVVFDGKAGEFTVTRDQSTVRIGRSGATATVTGGEILEFTDRAIVLAPDAPGAGPQALGTLSLLRDAGTTIAVADAMSTVVGGTGVDVVSLGGGGTTILLRGLETLAGGSGTDVIIIGDTGCTMIVSQLDVLIGGNGADAIGLGDTGSTIILRGLEVLDGGVGTDAITIGDTGTTMIVQGLEVLAGGAGTDVIVLGNGGATMVAGGLEILVGGMGTDIVSLGGGGGTMLLRGLEKLAGGVGTDVVFLGDTGATMSVSGLEVFVGGAGTDVIGVGTWGSTMLLRGIETLIGGTGTDIISFGDTGSTLVVSGVETVIGGAGRDVVMFTGADVRTVVLNPWGMISVAGFRPGVDRLVVGATLGSLIDKNGDGAARLVNRAPNEMTANDEVAILTAPVTSLDDIDQVAAAIGTVQGARVDATVLVLACTGNGTGAWLATDRNGDGIVAASEVRLVGVFPAANITAVTFG
jgi:hypothetical protein